MPRHSVKVECSVASSFAVDQVRGMFDLPAHALATESFEVELPSEDEPWRIGVIVGPSGSGKTTVARDAYGERFVEGGLRWEKNKAVVDHFGKLSMKVVTQTLTSVGFSSPPAWLKPYHVLSGGERFRCDLARALLRPGDLIAFDEFTSVVDRTVAKVGSMAVAKAVRSGRIGKRFVAVTCHYDILDWLEPDWVLDMATQQLARGCLHQRPPLVLSIAPVHRGAWRLFRRHHYLNHDIHDTAKCFAAFLDQEPVAFSAWITRVARDRRPGDMREHRTVVLPDYQGIGIGNRVSELCASIFRGVGGRAFSTTSHPSMIRYRDTSSFWRTTRFGMRNANGELKLLANRVARGVASVIEIDRLQTRLRKGPQQKSATSNGRVTGGFEYIGPAMARREAEAILATTPRVFGDDICDRILATIPNDGPVRSARSIASRSQMPLNEVSKGLVRLERSGQVRVQRVGRCLGYIAAHAD